MENIRHRLFTVKYLEVLPKRYPCPDCGHVAKRNSIGERTLQEPDLDQPTFLIVRMSVCRCDHPLCDRKYFRIPLPFARAGARYTHEAKGLCVSSITRDGMPFSGVPQRVAEDFHLFPSKSTVWQWHRQEAEGVDLTVDYGPWVKAQFSGVLCIDEVYDGPFCLILSTDPLNDVTVAYTLEKKAKDTQRPKMNQAWLDRHLAELERIGIHPQVVMRDGAVIYDEGLPKGWTQARCIFHLLQDITDDVLKAVNAYRKSLPDPPKRPRGRPQADAPPAAPNVKTEIWHHRHLWVSRPKTIEAPDRTCRHATHRCFEQVEANILQDLCEEHPLLGTLRAFMLDIWGLFDDPDVCFEQVKTRYETLVQKPAYRDNPHLQKALERLSGDTLEKACRFLEYENLPRTNNHVEGKARRFRKRQKSHYKLRRSATIDRALKMDLIRQKARKQAQGDPMVRLTLKSDAQEQTALAQAA
jgi:hypothetical protein